MLAIPQESSYYSELPRDAKLRVVNIRMGIWADCALMPFAGPNEVR
jgi:hypothetical protein